MISNIKENATQIVLIIMIILIAYISLFFNITNFGKQDFDYNFLHIISNIDAIKQYYEIPFWNPFDRGGLPYFEVVYSRTFSPFNILYFFFPAIIALKIEIILHIIISGIGVYFLTFEYSKNKTSSLYSAIIVSLCSYLPLTIAQSQFEFLTFAYLSWLFLAFKKRCAFKTSLILTLIFFVNGTYNLVISFLVLFLYSIFKIIFHKDTQTIRNFCISILVFTGLSAIKLFPVLSSSISNPRLINEFSGFSLMGLYHALLNPLQDVFSSTDPKTFFNQLTSFLYLDNSKSFMTGIDHGWDESGMLIGHMPLLLILLGLFIVIKKKSQYMPELMVFISSILFSMGNRLPISPWEVLHKFPIFDQMRHATRFRVYFLIIASILIAIAFNKVLDFAKRSKLKKVIIYLLFLMSVLEIYPTTHIIVSNSFPFPEYTPKNKNLVFKSIYKYPSIAPYKYEYNFILGYINNVSVIGDFPDHSYKSYVLPFNHKDYKGELYNVENYKTLDFKKRSFNKLIFEAQENNTYLINTNFNKNWSCKKNCKEIFNKDGRLAIVSNEAGQVSLYYRPKFFILGFSISIITMISIFLFRTRFRALSKDIIG